MSKHSALNRFGRSGNPAFSQGFGINEKNFEEELENMATDAETSGAPNLNPRVPTVNEMVDLYGKAWRAF